MSEGWSEPPHSAPLPAGTRLETYVLERPLSQGGYSMVYLARDAAGQLVAVKEYLPAGLVCRAPDHSVTVVDESCRGSFNAGMKALFEEARILSQLKHSHVVEVLNIFRANGTVYMIMRFERGRSLKDYLNLLQSDQQGFEEARLRRTFIQLLSGLREVHRQKLLHLDIKPANIYLRANGQPVLLDFGASRLGLGEGRADLASVHTPGYAAPEQEGAGLPQGPWTDIYAVGATMYACLGERPQAASERLQEDVLVPAQVRWQGQYSSQLLEVIDWCLRLDPEDRVPSVFTLQKLLNHEELDLIDQAWFKK